LWLLRDLPALVGIAWSFLALMTMVISASRRAMPGKKISPRAFECIMHMLPIAEAHLHSRSAARPGAPSAGTSATSSWKSLPPSQTGPTPPLRFEFYRANLMDPSAAATRFTEGLRRLYRIRTRVDANATHATQPATDAACSAAATHGLVGASTSEVALMLSSAQGARTSKHERGLSYARRPPTFPRLPIARCLCPRSVSFRKRITMPAIKTPSQPPTLTIPHAACETTICPCATGLGARPRRTPVNVHAP
jgi:hypothetical protein